MCIAERLTNEKSDSGGVEYLSGKQITGSGDASTDVIFFPVQDIRHAPQEGSDNFQMSESLETHNPPEGDCTITEIQL